MLGSAEALSGESFWCICHRLHLVVTDAILQDPRASQTVELVRNYSKAVRASTELSREFRNAQNTARPLSLSIDMATRWNSIFRMISKFVRLYEIILNLSLRESFRDISILPTFSECVQLSEVLEPLAIITTGLQGEGNLALAFYQLNSYLSTPSISGTFSNFQIILKNNFNDRFENDLTEPSLIARTSLLWPQRTGHVMSKPLQKECWEKLIEDIDFVIPQEDILEAQQPTDPESLHSFLPASSMNYSNASETKRKMILALEELRVNWTELGNDIEQKNQSLLEFWSSLPPGFNNFSP